VRHVPDAGGGELTRAEALDILAQYGLEGVDAETSLDAALKALMDNAYGVMAQVGKEATPQELMSWFGQDGGRAVIILGRAE